MSGLNNLSINRRKFMALSTTGAALVASGGGFAREAIKGDKSAAWYRFKIGDFEATVVSDGMLALGPYAGLYPKVAKDELTEIVKDQFLSLDAFVAQENCMVLNTSDKLVLFDSGMGASKAFGPGAGRLNMTLMQAGFKPEDIDVIVLTHAHVDHISGIMSADMRMFPNAQLAISKTEFDFWTDEAKTSWTGVLKMLVDAARANLLPNKDRLILVEDGKETIKGVTAIATPGHTPGHTSYVIASGGKSFLYTGDFVSHTALSFRHPEWAFGFDGDPAAASATRAKTLDMAAADGMSLIGYHFAFPGIGQVAREGGAYRFVPTPMEF